MTTLVNKRTKDPIPVRLIQNFDKHFVALFDPKIFDVGGVKIYVTKAGINVNGKDIDVAEWCHYTDLYDKSSFKVYVVKYLGLYMTIDVMKQITEYYLLLCQAEPV